MTLCLLFSEDQNSRANSENERNLPSNCILLITLLQNYLFFASLCGIASFLIGLIFIILQIAREVLDAAARVIRAGITTDEIDAVVHEATIAAGNLFCYHVFIDCFMPIRMSLAPISFSSTLDVNL